MLENKTYTLTPWQIEFVQMALYRERECHEPDNWETLDEFNRYTDELKTMFDKFNIPFNPESG